MPWGELYEGLHNILHWLWWGRPAAAAVPPSLLLPGLLPGQWGGCHAAAAVPPCHAAAAVLQSFADWIP
ncbi:hypothetical protein HaLaN_06932 [Haematococcus lacustris]|uniref:Uncharacterized protein n=1 Tax=Haematococcus lacustris TaxID=44745 RepID=A0A699YMC7_HAELA|nr:hypothetical protein HaLaN_06932 [Haematococcus lacustris]